MNDIIKLAIADDHRLFLDGMSALFDDHETITVVIKADNGSALLEQCKEGPTPDVVLLDLDMPVLDGIETLKVLKADYPKTGVVILSMHQEESFVLHLVEQGADGYLPKNSTFHEVVKAIEQVVETGYCYDDFIVGIMRKGLHLRRAAKETESTERVETFTPRELEVLDLLCQSMTATEIAEHLFLSRRTVEGHKKALLEKTGSRNTTGLVINCLKRGIIKLEDI